MAEVRVNNEDQECIIENYQVLKLEKYVLQSIELDSRKTESDFRNRNRHLSDEGLFNSDCVNVHAKDKISFLFIEHEYFNKSEIVF